MLCVLPFLSLCAWLRIFRRRFPRWRERFLVASVWWTLSLILITELLSGFDAIRRDAIAIAWCATATVTFVADIVWTRLRRGPDENVSGSGIFDWPKQFKKVDWFLLGSSVFILASTGVTALVTPPSGWDEALQHLPRAMEWLAQESVRLFPTNYYVQDFAPPLTEWTMLHLLLLGGSDRLVNLVQWCGSLGSALAVSLIAEEFGCTVRGQLLAALLCLTIPQGILSASGAKNDWLVAYWLSVAVFLILRWQRKPHWIFVAMLGIAMGNLLLTKGTGYVFGAPVFLVLLAMTPRSAWRKVPAAVLLSASIMVAVNAPQWSQNYRLGHSIFGLPAPDVAGMYPYRVDRVTPKEAVANLLRETSLHFALPSAALTEREAGTIRRSILAVGVDPDDPGQIRPDRRFEIHPYSLDEYYAGNPVHLLLAMVAFLAIAFSLRSMPREAALALGVTLSYMLYCAVFKWEVTDTRRHLGLFVLACPLIAAVMDRSYPRKTYFLAGLLVMLAIPDVLFNSTRPLVGSNAFRTMLHRPLDPMSGSIFFRTRDSMYFGESIDLEPSYLPAAEAVRKLSCTYIGLDTTDRPFANDYILMGIIDNGGSPRNFRYLEVKNLTSKFSSPIDLRPPCAVLCIHCLQDPEKIAEYAAKLPKVEPFGNVVLFRQATQSSRVRY